MEHYTLIGIAVILGVMLIFYIVYKIMFRESKVQKPAPSDNHRNRDNDNDDDEDEEDEEIHWFLEEDLY